MNIIQINANKSGSRPPIQTWSGTVPPEGYAVVPDNVDSSAMQTHAGFVDLTIEDGVVTAITGNDAAYQAYQAYLESLPPPAEPEPTTDELLNILLGVNDNG